MTRATDIEQRASEWIIRSEAGNFTDALRAEMERWLQADPRNQVTFLRIREAWRRASRVRSARPLDGNVNPDLLKSSNLSFSPEGNTSKPKWPFRIAAGAALTLITYLIGVVAWTMLGAPKWISYTTGIGGYENITLPDGSGVQLNTDTELRARVTQDNREILLIRGEALIKAAPDAHRAFTVRANGRSIRVDRPDRDGAIFSVRVRTPESLDVSVADGRVILGPTAQILDVALGRESEPESTVAAGEVAKADEKHIQLTVVGVKEIDRKLTWTQGLLSFQGETLTEVTDEFNRFNRKQLIVVDPAIAGRRIGGAFRQTDPDSFVLALQKWFGVHADERRAGDTGSDVIRLSKGK